MRSIFGEPAQVKLASGRLGSGQVGTVSIARMTPLPHAISRLLSRHYLDPIVRVLVNFCACAVCRRVVPHICGQRFACHHARLIGNGFRLISDNSVRLLPGLACIIINTMGSLCDTLHPLNKASLFIELISCLLGQTATSLSINLKDWCPSTGAISPGVNGDALPIVARAFGREQAF
jgi:hypothetical protein